MIGAIARISEPGCKHDHLPIIVGPQNWGKSRGLAALMPQREWFSDDLSVYLIDKDTKDSLVGVWLIELAEIPHIRKEAEKVKAFFSRSTDRFRRAYDRVTGDWPRTCCFAGSSNDLEFNDVTGNRRFWPITLARLVDIAAIVKDRHQLWGEALHCHRRGDIWWLPPNIEAIARIEQDRFVEQDSWDDTIVHWLIFDAPRDPKIKRPAHVHRTHLDDDILPFTAKQVLTGLGFNADPAATERRITKADEMRCARRLKRLGFQKDPHRSRDQGRAYLWTLSRK